jgi:hypothetical protein
MELTQRDYDERKARVEQGIGDDDDRRLVKQYESEGFEASKSTGGADGNPAGSVPGRNADGSDDGTGKPTGSEIRAQAGDTGSDVVGGVPVGRRSETTAGSKDTSTSGKASAGRQSGKQS